MSDINRVEIKDGQWYAYTRPDWTFEVNVHAKLQMDEDIPRLVFTPGCYGTRLVDLPADCMVELKETDDGD